jgi:transglutaminase-like putative cysteine protease
VSGHRARDQAAAEPKRGPAAGERRAPEKAERARETADRERGQREGRGRRGLTLAGFEPVVIAAVTILATLPLLRFYGGLGWLPRVAGAVVLGTLVGVVAAARRWRTLLTTAVAAIVVAGYALYAGYPTVTTYGLPGLPALRALGTGVRSGWARMLTVGLPGDVTGDLLVTPIVLGFAAGLVGTLLALRTRLVTPLAVPPLLLFVAGLLVTAARPTSWILLVATVPPALLLLLLLRSSRTSAADQEGIAERDADAVGLDLAARRWHSTVGRIAFGLPVVAVAAAVGLAGAWALPIADGSSRADPRNLRHQDYRLSAGLTPLVQVKPQLEAPATELFRVRVVQRGGSYPVDRVRVATLDSFDGALWTESRDFLITGSTLPEGPKLEPPTVQVELDVDVTRLPQQFLPVVGRPVHVGGADLAFDPANGTLVSTRPAVRGYSYRVVGEVRPQAGIAQAAAATDLPEYTALPDPPAWVSQLANDITRDWQTPWTQLSAIEKYLRGKGYALSARPGHSYGAVYRTLQGSPEEQVGYSEQFASAFAILARAKGYAARVAVGYRLQQQKRTGDRYRVDNTDAHAWPEVYLTGYGWVPFEPTNTGNPATSTPPRDSTVPALPDVAPKDQAVEPQADSAATAREAGPGGITTSRIALLIGLIVVAVPLLLLIVIVLAKAQRRRRRRHRGSFSVQIMAAWREVLDRLRERGLAVPPSTTPVEVARDVRTGPMSPAAPGLAELALIATAAVCAPAEPPPEAARRAWELEAEIRRALDATTPLLVRLRALIDPRPLLPRRRSRRSGPPAAKPSEPAEPAPVGAAPAGPGPFGGAGTVMP